MGSVSSLMSGHALHSKPCRTAPLPRKGVAGRRNGRGLDRLLKHSFPHDSSGNSNTKVSNRPRTSEEFLYIKVSHNSRGVLRSPAEEQDGEVVHMAGATQEVMPQSGKLDKSGEKASIPLTVFKPFVTRTCSSSVETHNNLSTILGTDISPVDISPADISPADRRKESQEPRQDSFSGTLSDSGRNSMSSLPTHSSGGSSRTENLNTYAGHALQCAGSSPNPALQEGVAGGVARSSETAATSWMSSGVSGNTCSPSGSSSCVSGSERLGGASEDLLPDHRSPGSQPTSTKGAARGGVRSPISTNESLIQQLERKLLDHESELVELQTCLEEKETHTCELFEENQRYCAEEMAGLQQRCSTRLRQASQRALQTQQMLQFQVLQLQQDKERLQGEVERLTQAQEAAENQLRNCLTQQEQLAPTLEETQWEVCQKAGEISLLKQQLKDSQCDVAAKLSEIVGLKVSLREAKVCMHELQQKSREYEQSIHSQSIEVEVCQNELQRKKREADVLREKVGKLEMDIRGMKQDLALAKEEQLQSLNVRGRLEEQRLQLQLSRAKMEDSGVCRAKMANPEGTGEDKGGKINIDALHKEVEKLREHLKEEKEKNARMMSSFQEERQTWDIDKDKVIRYQKQLQYNYLQMHRKNQHLEKILRDLTAEMESRTEQDMDTHSSDLHEDNVTAAEI